MRFFYSILFFYSSTPSLCLEKIGRFAMYAHQVLCICSHPAICPTRSLRFQSSSSLSVKSFVFCGHYRAYIHQVVFVLKKHFSQRNSIRQRPVSPAGMTAISFQLWYLCDPFPFQRASSSFFVFVANMPYIHQALCICHLSIKSFVFVANMPFIHQVLWVCSHHAILSATLACAPPLQLMHYFVRHFSFYAT